MNGIPVIIFHLSYKEYAKNSLEHNSKRNPIHFLTDDVKAYSDMSSNVTLVNISSQLSLINDFQNIYVHASPNSPVLEIICIVRWILIHQYMLKNNIQKAFICDSDVLLYDNVTDILPDVFFEDGCVLCTCPKHQIVTGGQSVWSLSRLGEFVKFIYEFYTTQTENIKSIIKMPRKVAGISDMTLLYYFIHNRKEFTGLKLEGNPHPKYALNDVYVVPNSNRLVVFDLHLDTHGSHKYPNEWAMGTDGRKVLRFHFGKPYGLNLRLKRWIQFSLLHFQGRNKSILKPLRDKGYATDDYWMTHDPTFLKTANLTKFNHQIKEYDVEQENYFIYNILKEYPRNSIFIDVGAYKGDSAVSIARKLKKDRCDIKFVCIEPNQSNCDIIREICDKEDLNIEVIQSVCSDTSGDVYMKSDEGSGTMYDTSFKGTKFSCNTLDELTTHLDISSNVFMKIDVEGHESYVLAGASRILSHTNHVYIELWNDDHYLERHPSPLYKSHNHKVLGYLNDRFRPLQKIEKNIIFECIG